MKTEGIIQPTCLPALIYTFDKLCHGKFVSQLGSTLKRHANRIQWKTYSPDMSLSDIKTRRDDSHSSCVQVLLSVVLVLIWRPTIEPSDVSNLIICGTSR